MSARNVIRGMVVAVVALLASNAEAFDFHGYFRDSVAFNSKGGGQVCFQIDGTYFKSRFANECGRYLEMVFGEGGKFQNVDWRVEFMPASAVGSDADKKDNFIMQQMWLGMRFNDWDGAQLWAGRRYWRRQAVNAIDWFYWNPAQGNQAVGVEDVKIGFGKLAVTLIGMDGTSDPFDKTFTSRAVYMVPDVRVYDIPVNPGGTIEVGVDLAIARDQNKALGADRAGVSPLFTVQHKQANVFGGSNLFVFQYGQGAFAKARAVMLHLDRARALGADYDPEAFVAEAPRPSSRSRRPTMLGST